MCGRKIAFEEAPLPPYPVAPPSYEIVLGEASPRPSAAAREPPAVEEKAPEAQVESKPAESLPPPQPLEAPRPVSARRFHITRRAFALSVAGVAVIVIVALAFLAGPITLPPLISTGTSTSTQASSQTLTTQTSSKTVTTEGTGPILQVQVSIARNPITIGSTQIISVTVLAPGGVRVPDASVHIEVVSPSGQTQAFDGSTDTNGHYSQGWHIAASADNVGTFQLVVSAAKDGYRTGQTSTTFQATPG